MPSVISDNTADSATLKELHVVIGFCLHDITSQKCKTISWLSKKSDVLQYVSSM